MMERASVGWLWLMLLGSCVAGGDDKLSAILDRLISLDQRITSLDLRITSLDHRFTSLDSRINGLAEAMATVLRQTTPGVTQVVTNAGAVCDDRPGGDDVSVGEGVETEAVTVEHTGRPVAKPAGEEEKPGVFFRLTRATKKVVSDKCELKVEYEASGRPTVTVTERNAGTVITDIDQTFDHVIVQIPFSTTDYRFDVRFYLADYEYMLVVFITVDQSSQQLPHINFERPEGRNVIFKPGASLTVKYAYTIEGDLDKVSIDEHKEHFLTKSKAEDNAVDRHYDLQQSNNVNDNLWPVHVSTTGTHGNRHVTLTFNSTREDVEGLLVVDVTAVTLCPSSCLVYSVSSRVVLALYRDDHAGPFPRDFVGFVRDDYTPTTALCSVGNPDCSLSCEAASNRLDGITLSRMLPDGSERLFPGSEGHGGERYGKAVLHLPHVTKADEGEYLCRARSPSREVTQALRVAVVRIAKVDEDRTGAIVLRNGSVKATCIAEGDPVPTVDVVITHSTLGTLNTDDYVMAVTHPSPTSTRMEVLIANSNIAAEDIYINCIARNVNDTALYTYRDIYFMTPTRD